MNERKVTVPEREYRGMREALAEAQEAVKRLAFQVERVADLLDVAQQARDVLDDVLSALCGTAGMPSSSEVGAARDALRGVLSGIPRGSSPDIDDVRDRHEGDADVQILCDEVERLRARLRPRYRAEQQTERRSQ